MTHADIAKTVVQFEDKSMDMDLQVTHVVPPIAKDALGVDCPRRGGGAGGGGSQQVLARVRVMKVMAIKCVVIGVSPKEAVVQR